MLHAILLQKATAAVREQLLHRRESIIVAVPNGVSASQLLARVVRAEPRLLACIDSWESTTVDLGDQRLLRLTPGYSSVLPSCVQAPDTEEALHRALVLAVRRHRREAVFVFDRQLLPQRLRQIEDSLHRADLINGFLSGLACSTKQEEDLPAAAVTVRLFYSVPYSRQHRLIQETDDAAEALARRCRQAGVEDWRRFYALVDYAVDHWQYGELPELPGMEFTAWAALTQETAVCMGFSLAVCAVCSRLGIPCRYVCGQRNGTGHAWNLVFLRGGWFYVDVTDAIVRQDPLFHWGMTSLPDRTLELPCEEALCCRCDAGFVRNHFRKFSLPFHASDT